MPDSIITTDSDSEASESSKKSHMTQEERCKRLRSLSDREKQDLCAMIVTGSGNTHPFRFTSLKNGGYIAMGSHGSIGSCRDIYAAFVQIGYLSPSKTNLVHEAPALSQAEAIRLAETVVSLSVAEQVAQRTAEIEQASKQKTERDIATKAAEFQAKFQTALASKVAEHNQTLKASVANKESEHQRILAKALENQEADLRLRFVAGQQDTVEQALAAAKRGIKAKNKRLLGLMALAFAGSVFCALHVPRNRASVFPATIKTLEVLPERTDAAIDWAIKSARKEIAWITTTPDDPRIINRIIARNRQGGVASFIVAGGEAKELALETGRQANITTFASSNAYGPINWLVVDSELIIDASTRYGVTVLQDPAKAKEIWNWVDQDLGPKTQLVYRAH